jgi:mannan endo-1,6-alpha-mannosidase
MHFSKTSLASGLLLTGNVLAIDLDVNDAGSIRDAAKTIASSIIDRYHNSSDIPGIFGNPYYFWEGGLAWDSLINYWYQTGDDSHNEIVGEALRFQLGENNDYLPANQTKYEGNDDQTFWALAAMTAAEYGFPSDVLSDLNTTWADIAINIFNGQAARWDDETCNGGLRWQIFSFNNGYNYKNSISNGNFYQLASRLTRFTYEDWSSRVIEWSLASGLISSDDFAVYDGTDTNTNCSDVNHIQWTAYAGTYLAGASYAYNAVSSEPHLSHLSHQTS